MSRKDAQTQIDIDFTMAFQPIVDTGAGGSIFAYEALVRGPQGQGADKIFAQVSPSSAIAFDAACRSRGLTMAASFGMKCHVNLNVSAAAILDRRHGIHTTLQTARHLGWPLGNLIFELTEHDPLLDPKKLGRWMSATGNHDVKIAIDDFGAGYAGLCNLLFLRPEIIKLDAALVRNVDRDQSRQALISGVRDACRSFGCTVIAEGVETVAEVSMLSQLGVTLMQGFLFAKPGLASLPAVAWPTLSSHVSQGLQSSDLSEHNRQSHLPETGPEARLRRACLST